MTKKQMILEGLMWILREKGYDCHLDGKEISISKNGAAIMSLGENGKHTSHSGVAGEYAAEIWEVHKNVKKSYDLYYKAEKVEYEHLNHYRKLADFNGIILAARMRRDNILEFATWEKARINTRHGSGNYFDYYGHAKEDFVVRAGLVDRNKLMSALDNASAEKNEYQRLPPLQNQQFVALLMSALKKQGYDCIQENGDIKVSKNGFPVADILKDGEYRVYRNTLNDHEYQQIRAINESLSEAYRLYVQGEPLSAQPGYHKMCELGNYVLAAKMMQLGYMEYVTWQQDAERTRVDVGHYFTDYEAAKEDFAVRAGLIDRHKMMSETEMKLIYQGLVHLGANAPDLSTEAMTNVGKLIEKVEIIVPALREREYYEKQDLVAEDGLEI